MSIQRRPLLIFADSAHTDCQRRGWPSAFRILLETQSFTFEENPGFDLHLFTSRGAHRPGSSSLQVHFQEGASFGQRLENAIESLAGLGYEELVIVGRDCPELGRNDIGDAFSLLRQHRLVLGPDHRGGCYLIGIHASDRENLQGIRWQRNTDCRQIFDRFRGQDVCKLAVKLDLDSLSDVWLLFRSTSRWAIVSELLRASLLGHPSAPARDKLNSSVENQRELWQFSPPLSQAS